MFIITLVTLQNMLSFQFKFYSYYLGCCSTTKFCQWIWRNPTDCAVVAVLVKFESHPTSCHLVQKRRNPLLFLSSEPSLYCYLSCLCPLSTAASSVPWHPGAYGMILVLMLIMRQGVAIWSSNGVYFFFYLMEQFHPNNLTRWHAWHGNVMLG